MNACERGCGQESTREFLPGHDQKLRITLEKKTGGILPLRALILEAELYANGQATETKLLKMVRETFKSAGGTRGAA